MYLYINYIANIHNNSCITETLGVFSVRLLYNNTSIINCFEHISVSIVLVHDKNINTNFNKSMYFCVKS